MPGRSLGSCSRPCGRSPRKPLGRTRRPRGSSTRTPFPVQPRPENLNLFFYYKNVLKYGSFCFVNYRGVVGVRLLDRVAPGSEDVGGQVAPWPGDAGVGPEGLGNTSA